MAANKQKLELTWIGKQKRPRLEPRILLEDKALSYQAEAPRVVVEDFNQDISDSCALSQEPSEFEYDQRIDW